MINFSNKKIIITGATGGIGTSLVKKFHSLGGKVLATGTNEEKLKKLNKEYPDIHTKKFDISKHDDIEEFINEAHIQLDGLDIIVNNAGITKDNLSLRMNKEEWEKVIGINLSSNFFAVPVQVFPFQTMPTGHVIHSILFFKSITKYPLGIYSDAIISLGVKNKKNIPKISFINLLESILHI